MLVSMSSASHVFGAEDGAGRDCYVFLAAAF
jgi:hypothetical protein